MSTAGFGRKQLPQQEHISATEELFTMTPMNRDNDLPQLEIDLFDDGLADLDDWLRTWKKAFGISKTYSKALHRIKRFKEAYNFTEGNVKESESFILPNEHQEFRSWARKQ